MSNIVPINTSNMNIPAHVAARMSNANSASRLTDALGKGIGGEAPPRISIKGGRFRLVEGGTETVLEQLALEAIVVGVNPAITKQWYATKWSPDNEPVAADCFSLDGVRPSNEAAKPQCDLCAKCPKNVWGSAINELGKQMKACSDSRRLAVVSADDPEGPVYLLSVTPAALAPLKEYERQLTRHKFPVEMVRTKITFDPSVSFPRLLFSFAGFNDEHTQSIVDGLLDSDKVKAITGEVDPVAVQEATTPKPEPAKPMLVKEAKATTVVISNTVEPEVMTQPEPEVIAQPATAKRGFGGKAAPVEPVPTADPAKPKRGFGSKGGATKVAEAPAKPATPAPKAVEMPAKAESTLESEVAALLGDLDFGDTDDA